ASARAPGASSASAAALPGPSTSSRIKAEPTGITSPTRPPSANTLPCTGEGTCTVALSVMTSASTWSSTTASPSFTCHSTSSTSAMPSPMSGILITYTPMSCPLCHQRLTTRQRVGIGELFVFGNERRHGGLARYQAPHGIGHSARAGEIGPFMGVGVWSVPTGDAFDGRFEVIKTVFLHQRHQLGTKAAGEGRFVQHQAP